ncbi:MAG: iron donor protein CyaY [Rhodospirillaceae bacterium]|jgi:frataxin|nr:MAG: iron donor protein CyaY [Rhodospirillaceae bacterium]
MMDQGTFERRASAVLEDLFDRIDEDLGDHIDADYEGGILTLKLSDGRTYLLNKHGPNREIWLSSPVSGAWHYAWDEGAGLWRSTRSAGDGPDDLHGLLTAELSEITGSDVELQD